MRRLTADALYEYFLKKMEEGNATFTDQESAVIFEKFSGKADESIAVDLGVKVGTVQTHALRATNEIRTVEGFQGSQGLSSLYGATYAVYNREFGQGREV